MPVDQSENGDHYSILHVSKNVTAKELRQAYLQLLVTAHPDKGGDAVIFAAIQKAYATLTNPEEREIYNEQLERKSGAAKERPQHANDNGASWQHYNGSTAYVHGQTRVPPSKPLFTKPLSTDNTTISSLTKQIRIHTQQLSVKEPGKVEKLVELYLQRAKVHSELQKTHHAIFDIEEALRLSPGNVKGLEMLAELEKAIEI